MLSAEAAVGCLYCVHENTVPLSEVKCNIQLWLHANEAKYVCVCVCVLYAPSINVYMNPMDRGIMWTAYI